MLLAGQYFHLTQSHQFLLKLAFQIYHCISFLSGAIVVMFHANLIHRQCFDIVPQFYILDLKKSSIFYLKTFHAKEPVF